jgi:hypothetical protein
MTAVSLRGHWYVTLYDLNGNIKDQRSGENVITTDGKEALARYLMSAARSVVTNPFVYVAVGTGSTSETAADTALGTESARATGVATYTSGAIYEITATFPAGTGTGAITEYGLFNSSSAGTMLSRDVEAVINKGASDILTTTLQITLS